MPRGGHFPHPFQLGKPQFQEVKRLAWHLEAHSPPVWLPSMCSSSLSTCGSWPGLNINTPPRPVPFMPASTPPPPLLPAWQPVLNVSSRDRAGPSKQDWDEGREPKPHLKSRQHLCQGLCPPHTGEQWGRQQSEGWQPGLHPKAWGDSG